ncbi:phosphorylated adapter RNA export protein [Paragonimus westermani]|uniref:Phosphorylated adapter RNA export protein n=1 Tax=Paragonimus westermani TaxID=34504 RepID=A0A5J4NRA9_9TREM|nr:phosphorylated adapter RNA export protein [Paragonimus westermani]
MAHRSQLLKDSSESDDNDDEVFWKKRTSSGVKRTADSFDSEASPNQSRIARRSIWLNVLNENKLNEALSKVNVQENVKMPACLDNCAVHSDQYNTNAANIRKRSRRRSYNRNRPSEMRVCEPQGDKSVFRTNCRMKFKRALVKLLKEPNEELISQVVHILGVKRTLEFYFLTEEVENAGGLHTANPVWHATQWSISVGYLQDGSRRRSPGGVFLNLIKNSNNVADLEKAKIFATTKRTKELSKRRRRQARRLRNLQSGSVNELGQFRSEFTSVEYSVQANSAKHEDICSKTEADPQPMNSFEEGEISSFEDEEDEFSAER